MIVAVIPTLHQPPTLKAMLEVLDQDGIHYIIKDTTGCEPRIYEWWNELCDMARFLGATEIAVLNDDIVLCPGAIPALVEALRSDDEVAVVSPTFGPPCVNDETSLVYSEGHWWWWSTPGFTGWNFVFKAELDLPRFDEGYHWYGGDNQFEEDVRLSGWKVAGVKGVYCDHLGSYSTRKQPPAGLSDMTQHDRARWAASYRGPGTRPAWPTHPGDRPWAECDGPPPPPDTYARYKWEQRERRLESHA